MMARQTKKQVESKPDRILILDDPAVRKEFMDAITLGATIKDSCGVAGFSEDTLARYLKTHEDFADTFKRARHKAKVACVGSIRKAAIGNWTAAAWFLERSDPANWGRKDVLIQLGIDPALLKDLKKVADSKNIPLSDVFEAMMQELANVDSTRDSTE